MFKINEKCLESCIKYIDNCPHSSIEVADVVSYFRDVYSEHDINFALNDLREYSFIYGGVRIIEESNNKYSMNISTIRLF